MSILAPDKIRSLGDIINPKTHSRSKVDLQRVGQDIYDVLNQKPRRKGYKARQRERHVVLDPNKHYRVADVSAALNVSYDKALTLMRKIGAANLGTPERRYKRGKSLLVVSGRKLMDYLKNRTVE